MTTPLPKAYDFKATEQELYQWWNEKGYFGPSNDPKKPDFDPGKKPFVISIPPPNVTGELHLGHALFVSMEDLMIRHMRMKGVPALWVPGSDHAGIATQLKVEKSLLKEGTSREAIGREEFLKRTWAWKEKYGGMIQLQIRRLGASCDWTRERFTLDEGLSKAVREAFVRLYEKGLIYRGPRMINWSPGLRTAVSDLEVEYSDEMGTLYYFKYAFTDEPDAFIPVATTRPETILGDTAVCVHPDDERYKKYIGRKVIVPILGREIPVIADEYVTREFGTGALKITPAHDPNDYALAQKHNLEFISMLDESAHVNENGGPYQGMDRFECRKKLWEDMRERGLVIKEEPYKMTVPRSQRGGELIEPIISTQWFIKIKPLADAALEAVRDGRIKIVPDRFTKVYYNWLENIQDWCISRQLWWGHRIPVWYCDDCNKMTVQREDPQECAHCHSKHIHQDPDVLDTWFSSGLWPFSTLGWPEKTPDLEYFYPTSVMETGYDILFFWVARMIMFGLEFTGQVPFSTVYLHGLVRDEHGQKMSKSKGVAIDPLDLMNEFSTDALRFTMLVGSTPGNDTNVSAKKVEANRNFTNKVWNAGRFVIGALEQAPSAPVSTHEWTLADRWIWARLQQLLRDVERLFAAYQFGEAGRQIYEFFWSEFADWYIEIAKLQMAEKGDRAYYTAQMLIQVLDACLRMLHPYTPFVTEALWGHLKQAAREHPANFKPFNQNGLWEDALIIAHWPEPQAEEGWEGDSLDQFAIIQEIVRSIRNFRAEKQVAPGKRITATFAAGDKEAFIKSQMPFIAALAYLDITHVSIVKEMKEKPEGQIALVISGIEIYLPLSELVDMDAEKARMEKELSTIEGEITRLENLLASPFGQKAPAAVVEKERQKLESYKETAQKIKLQLM
jgi:valyl-tRNA synthetase